MAEQQGILSYSGKLGETVGYHRGGKYFKRTKPGSYQPGAESLKSGAEFGRGSTACVILKRAFEPMLLRAFSADLHNRLAGKLRQIIRTGPPAKKGTRGVFEGDISLLKGFEFNSQVSFRRLCCMDVNTTVTADEVMVSIKPFKWQDVISAPTQAQSVKIGLCCVFADFTNNSFSALRADDLQLFKGKDFVGGRFKVAVPQLDEVAVLLMMNVFFEGDSGYRIENKKFQAGVILDAVHIKDGEVVEFVAEELPAVEEVPVKAPDAFWVMGWDGEE